jgi:hypothetical protein
MHWAAQKNQVDIAFMLLNCLNFTEISACDKVRQMSMIVLNEFP